MISIFLDLIKMLNTTSSKKNIITAWKSWNRKHLIRIIKTFNNGCIVISFGNSSYVFNCKIKSIIVRSIVIIETAIFCSTNILNFNSFSLIAQLFEIYFINICLLLIFNDCLHVPLDFIFFALFVSL